MHCDSKSVRMGMGRFFASLLCVCALCFGSCACGQSQEPAVLLSFIDVGQADCILVECPAGTVLVDTGTAISWETLRAVLQIHNVDKIEYLVLTHAHDDHIGAADEVLASFAVDCVVMPDYDNITPTDASYSRLRAALEMEDVSVWHPAAGDSFAVGDVCFSVLGPFTPADGSNADSLVLRMTYAETAVLFMADAEIKTENALMSYVTSSDLKAQIIKIGHHGSSGSTGASFLAVVSPNEAVISCGVGNSFGHPAAQVTELLAENDVTVYRTDKEGTVIFQIDKNGYRKVSR